MSLVNLKSVCVLFLLCLATGCGSSEPTPVSTKGVVKTKSGRPCDNALVVFHPLDQGRVNDPKPVATTNAEGQFVLTTFAVNDGAIPGEYAVTVVWPGQDAKTSKMSMTGEGGAVGADQLKGKFGNPSKPLLKVTVPKEGAIALTFEVD